jgi:DNA-binding HxlR family transcriptional regulator
MERTSFADMPCSIARSLDEVGEGWSLLILRDALLGARRFQDFEERLAIPPNTLARRLKALCERGLLERKRYAERPPRDEYALTDKGRDLLPVILSLAAWGSRWLAPNGPPLLLVDATTGRPIEPVLIDRKSRRVLGAGRVALTAGPTAPPALRRALSQKRAVFGGAV